MTLTQAEMEARYDAERSGEIYTKPEPPQVPAGERSPLFYDLKAWIESHFEAEQADQIAIARACDQAIAEHRARVPSTAVLDVATARAQALSEWEGKTTRNDEGAFRRYPELPAVEIGQLHDGTPVEGRFDHDDTPLVVWADYEGFSICADEAGFDLGDDEEEKDYYHLTIAHYKRLKELVNSGVLDQMLAFGAAWEAQRTAMLAAAA
jgi:hypothetical protein